MDPIGRLDRVDNLPDRNRDLGSCRVRCNKRGDHLLCSHTATQDRRCHRNRCLCRRSFLRWLGNRCCVRCIGIDRNPTILCFRRRLGRFLRRRLFGGCTAVDAGCCRSGRRNRRLCRCKVREWVGRGGKVPIDPVCRSRHRPNMRHLGNKAWFDHQGKQAGYRRLVRCGWRPKGSALEKTRHTVLVGTTARRYSHRLVGKAADRVARSGSYNPTTAPTTQPSTRCLCVPNAGAK